jgi:hypothetical protein
VPQNAGTISQEVKEGEIERIKREELEAECWNENVVKRVSTIHSEEGEKR